MKFEKLYNLVVESGFNPSSPKSMGGNKLFRAKESEGPGSYAASSVGRSDNNELAKPIVRWDFDPSQIGDIGSKAGSMLFNSLATSFGLLRNDDTFVENFNKLAKDFGNRRASYGLSRTVEDFRGREVKEKYDYESKLDNLNFMKSKRTKQVTELQHIRQFYQIRVNDYSKYSSSPTQLNRLNEEYAETSARVKAIEKNNKESENTYFFDILDMYKDIEEKEKILEKLNHEIALTKSKEKIKKIQTNIDTINENIVSINSKINSNKYGKILPEVKRYRSYDRKLKRLEAKHTHANLDESTVNREKAKIFDLDTQIKEMEQKYQDAANELSDVEDHINQINVINEEADSDAQVGFIDLVNSTARRLITELQVPKDQNYNDFSQINWNDLPVNNKQKIERLQALTSEDPNTNPFIGYLERFQRAYDNREYHTNLQLNKNANITTVRDFENLPFSIIMKIYKGVSNRAISLKGKEYDESKDESWKTLSEYLLGFNGMKGDELFDSIANKFKSPEILEIVPSLMGLKVKDVWSNKISKYFIKKMINELGLPESFKMRHILSVSSPRPMITSRTGANSFFQLWSSINADINSTKVKKESFDNIYLKLISNASYDEDDFKLDTMEVLSLVNKPK